MLHTRMTTLAGLLAGTFVFCLFVFCCCCCCCFVVFCVFCFVLFLFFVVVVFVFFVFQKKNLFLVRPVVCSAYPI